MKTKILYHGSRDVIRKPEYGAGKPYNDYGQGFYCTEHLELAKEWSCSQGVSGFANKYELSMDGLNILDLSSANFTILHWLTILIENRRVRTATPVAREGLAWLRKHFHVDVSAYDLIVGYRADDAYFSFARSFLNNAITLDQLSFAMRLGKLGEQYVLKSRKAFKSIKFISSEPAAHDVYVSLKEQRDSAARAAFEAELERERPTGIYMQTILENKMDENDVRLR